MPPNANSLEAETNKKGETFAFCSWNCIFYFVCSIHKLGLASAASQSLPNFRTNKSKWMNADIDVQMLKLIKAYWTVCRKYREPSQISQNKSRYQNFWFHL